MTAHEDWKYLARKNLIESAMSEIHLSKKSTYLYRHVYYCLAKLALHLEAEQRGLLDKEAWQQREHIEQLIKTIKKFLWKEIK